MSDIHDQHLIDQGLPSDEDGPDDIGLLDEDVAAALAAESHDSADTLQSQRNEAALEKALASLSATKLRTGAPSTRADLHRVIKKYSLSPVDAAELEAKAEEADLLETDAQDELGPATGFDVDSVRMFLDDARRYRLLRPEEHRQLARAMAIARDAQIELSRNACDPETRRRLEHLVEEGKRARSRFVASNVRLVVSVAKGYLGQGVDFADLIQEGCCGLMRAVELFSPQEGTQFSTYAYWWIMQSMTRAIAEKSRLVRLPVHAHDALNRIRRATRELMFRFGREPSYTEIAEHLGLTPEKVAALSQWLHHVLSLEAPAGEEGDTDFKYFIAASDPPLDEQVADRVRDAALMRLIEQNLTERQASVVKMRFGLNGTRPMTLEEVGQKYGVTRERIRQIEAKALKILRYRIRRAHFLET